VGPPEAILALEPPPPQPLNNRLNRINATNMDVTFTLASRPKQGYPDFLRKCVRGDLGEMAPRVQCPLESDSSLNIRALST
jgi:hypothetical protein